MMSGTGCIPSAGERDALPAVMRGRGAGAPKCGARTRRWRPVTAGASARSAGSSIPVPTRCAAGRAGSAGPAWPRWIRRRVRSVGESRRGPGRRRSWPRRRPTRRAAPAGSGTSSRRASARSTPAAAREPERARPGGAAVHVLPDSAHHRHARAPVPFLERPDCRVRPRLPPPHAPHPAPPGACGGSRTAT